VTWAVKLNKAILAKKTNLEPNKNSIGWRIAEFFTLWPKNGHQTRKWFYILSSVAMQCNWQTIRLDGLNVMWLSLVEPIIVSQQHYFSPDLTIPILYCMAHQHPIFINSKWSRTLSPELLLVLLVQSPHLSFRATSTGSQSIKELHYFLKLPP